MTEPSKAEAAESMLARREAQKQWEANPCGASTVRGVDPESLEWFREARRVRYDEYAPWLRGHHGHRASPREGRPRDRRGSRIGSLHPCKGRQPYDRT